MSHETIQSDIRRLLAEGHDLTDILINDGCEEWGADCAVSRDQAEKLAGEWEREGQSTEALKRLTSAVAWLKQNMPECGINFPCIALLVPHQNPPRAYVFYDVGEFWTIADLEAGDNWEWPGHCEDPNDEDSEWICDRTIDDGIEALGHDVHLCALCSSEAEARELYANLKPGALHHQCFAARRELKIAAKRLDWIV